MPEKMADWLDQYKLVSEKHDEYVNRIHQLRQRLEHNDNKHVLETVDNMQSQPLEVNRRKCTPRPLTRMEGSPVIQGPSPFPSRLCHFHEDKCASPKLTPLAPISSPQKFETIIKCSKNNETGVENVGQGRSQKLTFRPGQSPIRADNDSVTPTTNRSNHGLTQFFNSSLSHRRRSHKRIPKHIPIVNITKDKSEVNVDRRAFITDISSKKHVIQCNIKRQKHE